MTRDTRICFVGDSFVNGTGDETFLGWTGRLCTVAGVPVTGYNLGIRRDTTRDILLRWERECVPRLSGPFDGRLVFSGGVNDAAIEGGRVRVDSEESGANMQKILRAARSYRVLVVGPPPVSDEEWNARIRVVAALIARAADAQGVPYIDLFTPLVADEDYRNELLTGDGAHPGSAGYAKMSRIIGLSPQWWFSSGPPDT